MDRVWKRYRQAEEGLRLSTWSLPRKRSGSTAQPRLAVTKLDVVFPQTAGVREYTKLPADARKFIENIEDETGLNVTLIGTGKEVYDIIDRRSW